MDILITISMLVKVLMLLFGTLAYKGHGWAYILFIVIAAATVLFDIVMVLVARSVEKDIQKETL